MGVPPTALNARTDEFTPPGITFFARVNAAIERSLVKIVSLCGGSKIGWRIDIQEHIWLHGDAPDAKPGEQGMHRAVGAVEHLEAFTFHRGAIVERRKRLEAVIV